MFDNGRAAVAGPPDHREHRRPLNPSASGRPPVTSGESVRATIGNAEEIASTTSGTASPSGNAEQAATAEQSFSFSVLKQSVESSPSTNAVASPYSLAEALLMLELGAKGPTAVARSAPHWAWPG